MPEKTPPYIKTRYGWGWVIVLQGGGTTRPFETQHLAEKALNLLKEQGSFTVQEIGASHQNGRFYESRTKQNG